LYMLYIKEYHICIERKGKSRDIGGMWVIVGVTTSSKVDEGWMKQELTEFEDSQEFLDFPEFLDLGV